MNTKPSPSGRLHSFVLKVHTFAVMNPGLDLVQKMETPNAISDVNALLKAERFNSVRAILKKRRMGKPVRKVKRRKA